MKVSFLAFAALLLRAFAQDTTTTVFTDAGTTSSSVVSTDSTTATSTSSQPFTTTIAVGRAGNTFEPDVVQISPGNYVEFDFYPTNHSVIRAEYKYPCIPYELTGIDKVGFYSGPQPVDAILANPPKWTLLINDSNPVFFYCGAPNSCIGWEMVGVINPNASVSLQVQKQLAGDSSYMLLPGQNFPDEQNPFATTSTSTSTATTVLTATATSSLPSTTSAGTASPTIVADHSASSHTSLSSGAIAGIAIGGAAVLLAAAALLYFCGRRSKSKERSEVEASQATHQPPAYIANHPGYNPPANKSLPYASSTPLTDAFGNTVTPTSGIYGYPGPFPQGYQPLQMQPNPMTMMHNPGPVQPHPSPRADIFGPVAAPQQVGTPDNPPPSVPSASMPGTQEPSIRAGSPTSVHAASLPAAGGIEAFLQRQGRMSPQPEGEPQAQQPLVTRYSWVPGQDTGPYEMSASGTMNRRSLQ